jgi:kynurenine formamidase
VRLIDLTHPIHTGMPVWPGDPQVELRPAATIAEQGWNLLALHLGSQSGTHVDAPFHVDDGLPTLGEIPLERFTGRALVADVRGLSDGAPIGLGDLAPTLGRARPGDVLLLCTGWSEHWGTARYGAHPWLHPDAARAVVEAGIRTVGIDAPSVDTDASALPTHRVLAAAHAVIAENLRGLEKLLEPVHREGRVWLLPLALDRADGSPVRAVVALD